MNAQVEAQLERIKYRSTLYELAMSKGGQSILIAYSKPGRNSMYRAMVKRVDHFKRVAGTVAIDFAKRAQDGATTPTGWRIHFTGRTQRDAIIHGELPYIADC